MVFFEKLDEIYSKYQQLSRKMADPAVIADSSVWTSLAKEQAEISETAEKYAEYKEAARRLTDTAAALKDESDPEMRMACWTALSKEANGRPFSSSSALQQRSAVSLAYSS